MVARIAPFSRSHDKATWTVKHSAWGIAKSRLGKPPMPASSVAVQCCPARRILTIFARNKWRAISVLWGLEPRSLGQFHEK